VGIKDQVAGWLLAPQVQELQETVVAFQRAMAQRPWLIQEDAGTLDMMRRHAGDYLLSPSSLGEMSEQERLGIVAAARYLYEKSVYAEALVRIQTDFGFGRRVNITPDDDKAKEVFNEFWTAKRNRAVLGVKNIQELSDRLCVDGEFFLVFFTATAGRTKGQTYVRLIRTEQIIECITDPNDSATVLYYRREWTPANSLKQQTLYYPDWMAEPDQLDRAKLLRDAKLAQNLRPMTAVRMMHVKLPGLEKRGLSMLMRGTPWIELNKEFAQDRAAVIKSIATFTEKVKFKSGSRGLKLIAQQLQSSLVTGDTEMNPNPTAGSTWLENEAATRTRMPLSTGAVDAEKDGALFLRSIALSGGVFPHWLGAGESFRLATASAMEMPTLRHFARYQMFWESVWGDIVDVVLSAYEDATGTKFESHGAYIALDSLLETNLTEFSQALKTFSEVAKLPIELRTQLALEALNVSDAQDILKSIFPEELTEEIAAPRREQVIELVQEVLREMEAETPQAGGIMRGILADLLEV